jgi:hypothetical protein
MRKAISLVLALGLMSGSVFAQAALDIPKPTFDFGYVPQQSVVSTDFWLKSSGTEDLKILKVIPGCGCTKAPLEKDVLVPGDSTRLEVIFSTKRFTNRVTKNPRIQTNAGDQKVEFMSTVVRRPDSTYPIVIKPYKLDLSQPGGGASDEIRFTVQNISDQDLSLLMVASRKELFSVDLPGQIKAGQSVEGVLKLTADGAAKDFEKSFTFEVSDATTSRFTVPVKRSLHPTPEPSPEVSSTGTRKGK